MEEQHRAYFAFTAGRKKYLKIKKIGRRNEYVAAVTEQEYQTMQTHSFLNKVYGGNVKNLYCCSFWA